MSAVEDLTQATNALLGKASSAFQSLFSWGRIFDSTADALDIVSEGDYFGVYFHIDDDASTSYVQLHKLVNGVAVALDRYLTGDALQTIQALVAEDRVAANEARIATASDRVRSGLSADQAVQAAGEARATANATGAVDIQATYADALAKLPSYPANAIVEVITDEYAAEPNTGARTRYRVEGGVLVFKVNMDQWRVDLADPAKGLSMSMYRQMGEGAVSRSATEKVQEIALTPGEFVGATDQQRVIGARAAAQILGRPLDLALAAVELNAPLDLRTVLDGFRGARGRGQNRSVFVQQANNTNGVLLGGRYARNEGFTVKYAVQQGKTDTASIGIVLNDYTLFNELSDITVEGAYIGIGVLSSGESLDAPVQFSNVIKNYRAINCYYAGFVFGVSPYASSGSVYENIYVSNIGLGSVQQMGQFLQSFAAQVIRLNLERSTVRDLVLNMETAHSPSINGLNCEELSLIGSGFSDGQSFRGAFFRSSGQGKTAIQQLIIDSCHIGGYIVTNLVASGTTAVATLELMGFQQKLASGSGFTTADTIFIAGANAAQFNGAHQVTAVGPVVDGKCAVSFTIDAGAPASAHPADESGSDCITANLGNTQFLAAYLFDILNSGGIFEIDGLHIRDMKCIANSPANRRALLRFARIASGTPAKVKIKNISTRGQQSTNSHWLGPVRVAGWSRTANAVTLYFTQPHGLTVGAPFIIYDSASGIDGYYTVTSVTGQFAITVQSSGADTALTRETTARAILATFNLVSVSRSNGYATFRTSAAHTIRTGHQVVNRCNLGGFNSTGASGIDTKMVLAHTLDTFTVRSPGEDLAETALSSGYVMLVEAGLPTSTMHMGQATGLVEVEGFFDMLGVSESGAVPAGGSINRLFNAQLVLPTDSIEILSVSGAHPGLTYRMEPGANNTVSLTIGNPSAGVITSPAVTVRYRIVR